MDGATFKAVTGVDDHSRFCVIATLMPRENARAVCAALVAAMRQKPTARMDYELITRAS